MNPTPCCFNECPRKVAHRDREAREHGLCGICYNFVKRIKSVAVADGERLACLLNIKESILRVHTKFSFRISNKTRLPNAAWRETDARINAYLAKGYSNNELHTFIRVAVPAFGSISVHPVRTKDPTSKKVESIIGNAVKRDSILQIVDPSNTKEISLDETEQLFKQTIELISFSAPDALDQFRRQLELPPDASIDLITEKTRQKLESKDAGSSGICCVQ